MIEYALTLGLVSAASIFSVAFIGKASEKSFHNAAQSIQNQNSISAGVINSNGFSQLPVSPGDQGAHGGTSNSPAGVGSGNGPR